MKHLLCITLALLLTLSLVACGKGEKETSGNNSGNADVVSSEKDEASSKKSAAGQQGGSKTSSTASTASAGTANTSSKKVYVDADKDFTGQVTIVGRWRCRTEIRGEEQTDVWDNGQYYIFESNGMLEADYHGTTMLKYDGYLFDVENETKTYKEGKLRMTYSGVTMTLACKVEEKKLTISTLNASDNNITTVYERVDFPK